MKLLAVRPSHNAMAYRKGVFLLGLCPVAHVMLRDIVI